MKHILLFVIITIVVVVVYTHQQDKDLETENTTTIKEQKEQNNQIDGFESNGFDSNGFDESEIKVQNNEGIISKRKEILSQFSSKEIKKTKPNIVNEIANNLNQDITINYFDASEKSILLNTHINESFIDFNIEENANVREIKDTYEINAINNKKASKINLKEFFIGVSQGKIDKIIVENAIGEKQKYSNLNFENINNSHYIISGHDGVRGEIYIYLAVGNNNEVLAEGRYRSTILKHKRNYIILNKEGHGYVYDIYKKN